MHKFPNSGSNDSAHDASDGSFSNDVFKAAGIVLNGASRAPPVRMDNNLKMRKVTDQSWLQNGERLMIEEQNVGYLSPICKVVGKVYVTNYRLRFEGRDPHSRDRVCQFEVPLGFISRVEKIGHSNVSRGEDSYGIELTCKDMRNIRFTSTPANHSRRALFDALQKYAFPLSHKMPLFATNYSAVYRRNGWDIYDPIREFRRMGVPNDVWAISRINERYEFSETYPSLFAIPQAAQATGEDFLRRVGEFRSRQRIPVLSWINPETSAAITRSSQPMVGMTSRKSPDDERYLQMIVEANANSHQLPIFDARPSVNAKVNRAKGGGFEDSYPGCRLEFCDIQNIHVVRESLRKVKDACFPRIDHKNWYRLMDDAKWLYHIQTIIDGSMRIVTEVYENKSSVLVHCSDGWDRTAQLTSLAMIQMDPYYRTIEGFAVLIEKEWCSFGHKFAHRVGHGEDKHGDGERSPIFVQFIDCVWQLYNQFDQMFEFNVHFLITILDELYACRFGTFLYNSEKQRFAENNAKQNTLSLWSFIQENLTEFLNPNYLRVANSIDIIRPTRNIMRMKLWNEYYCRHNPTVVAQDRQVGLCAEDVHPPLAREDGGGAYGRRRRKPKLHGGQPSPSSYFYQDPASTPPIARRHSYSTAVGASSALADPSTASLRRPVRKAPPPPSAVPKASEREKNQLLSRTVAASHTIHSHARESAVGHRDLAGVHSVLLGGGRRDGRLVGRRCHYHPILGCTDLLRFQSTEKYANEYLLLKRGVLEELVKRQENHVHRFQQQTDV
uniref:phosphatidylinositol-3,5-bisphosphate 3-phosphatase n=1 Tax=Steinernema glaseri TaxID=37863 RepID=A0A1I8AD37_9BILA